MLLLMGQADQYILKKLREFGWTADIIKQMNYIDSTNEVKLQVVDARRATIQLPPLETWQGIREHY